MFRDFFWLFARRDMSMRYAGSSLGALWNLIHPLFMIGIYMMIFSSLMQSRGGAGGGGRVDYGGLAYGVHLCAGLIPWLLFTDVLTRSLGVLIENGNFLKKASFPPEVLFMAVLFNGLVIYGVGYLAFLGLLALLGPTPPVGALGELVVMALLGAAAMGIGMALAVLNVFLRDVAQVLTVLLQVLFWLSPIVYFKEMIRAFDPATPAAGLPWLERVGRVLIWINPFERFISAGQWLVGQSPHAPSPRAWCLIALFPAICLAGGLYCFRRLLPDARDCL
jgi:lipopolysaccharide transport system permease protein